MHPMQAVLSQMVEAGLVGAAELDRARHVSAQTGASLALTLSRLGIIADVTLAQAYHELAGLPLADRSELGGVPSQAALLSPIFLRKRGVYPFSMEDGALRVAMADPGDDHARDAIEFATGCPVEPSVAPLSDIEDALASLDLDAASDEVGGAGSSDDLDRISDESSDAPIIRLVRRLLANAVRQRASDVHIEPMARHLSVRYRVDGKLSEVERHPADASAPVTSRIKVMAGLDIAETRLPQDGRLRFTAQGRDVDVRVSTSPIAHGESVVMRLLGQSEVTLDLDALGMQPAQLKRLTNALARPHGIILLTGPTGSGKTTTLYAAINRLRRPDVKILTVEDPVEVLLDGVNQVQVRPEIELSYAATLRAFLRQDPDILMIGEIRDGETAEVALRAALTGHLVLSTLHTNSALGAFTRLADLGVEPYLASSTVIATAAQRLVRSLCTACRRPGRIATTERDLFALHDVAAPETVYEAVGCDICQQTGFRGRIPLIEVVTMDDALRSLVRDGRAEAYATPYGPSETLLGHGLRLAALGTTSLGEVNRTVAAQ